MEFDLEFNVYGYCLSKKKRLRAFGDNAAPVCVSRSVADETQTKSLKKCAHAATRTATPCCLTELQAWLLFSS